uniref:Glia maturation factor n=1 Tax=Anolis carolinensis TaxID=28377 RepID=H9GEK6_ANOCA
MDPELMEKLKKFRFRKETNNAAIVKTKVPFASLTIVSCTFIAYSYKYIHEDGRISYPLCFIFCSPVGCKPEQQMMYAGSKNRLVQAAELTKVFEIRSTDDLTEQWLKERLAFFR